MPDVHAADLHRLASDLLCAVGTERGTAEIVADSLVDANLAGHDSHGVLRLPAYLAGARQGHVVPTAVPHRSYHIGRVATYVESIAREGMIGQAMANAAPAVAPFGGRSRVMGTNPMAWAAPRAVDAPPICLDVATAGVAEGKLRVARARGFPVPAGNIVDREGRPTTDPGDFYAGGALLPFGGHKGSGFSLLAQFIGRGLAQMDPSGYDGPRGVNGPFILAIDVARFTDLEQFRAEVEAQCAVVTNSLPAEGVEAVLLPGQPELAMRTTRERG